MPASKNVQYSFAGRSADSPREARACRPAICGASRRVSLAEKRLRGQPLSARRDRFGLPRGPAGRWPLARAEARRPLARRRVRLCTRGTRRCAQADKGGSLQPILCPILHTHERPVCTSGQERRHSAGPVSDFAHANRRRVHKRTRNRPNRPSRVRLCTRASVPCAKTDTSCLPLAARTSACEPPAREPGARAASQEGRQGQPLDRRRRPRLRGGRRARRGRAASCSTPPTTCCGGRASTCRCFSSPCTGSAPRCSSWCRPTARSRPSR